ncbi:hypothetical protein B9479_000292 [Cryptococcus floricola]|uniref:TM7S3/TM198-like domain-containing protein n=1 Tax=Cryptococcus floricola TaxID=2591691 RepID=A0A5D3B9E8_9TREE|nr:hypothetical protein B9479_000292 [Cryptococcus floricola]
MRLTLLALALPLAFAQTSSNSNTQSQSASQTASTSSNATSSASTNSTSTQASTTQTTLTTTLTTFPTTTSLSENPAPSTYTLTFTLASSSDANSTSIDDQLASLNTSISNGTYTDDIAPDNGTLWHEGDGWIPFHIVIDPAYGIAGAFLIITGIPVATLGGKNRWSALAISSGYALMLFTLVLILRFGVEPDINTLNPNPPSKTTRGLYLLATLVSALIGGGAGIFFFNFAKYAISAGGGFTFAWFLLACKEGGLVPTTLGRWGFIGGMTVAWFVAGLPKLTNEWMMLVSTGFIGATAFVLGVDCYTRAGLKEFYIYNLGFHDLFPKLNGAKYPLTQTMMIELGIIGAFVIVGAAIQFRVLNILSKKLKHIQEEEEAKIEAAEVARAAERFKNVGVELEEWEGKYGVNGTGGEVVEDREKQYAAYEAGYRERQASAQAADRSSVLLPQLGLDDSLDSRPSEETSFTHTRQASSTLSLLNHDSLSRPRPSSSLSLLRQPSAPGAKDKKGVYESVNPDTPTPTGSMFGNLGMEELKLDLDTSPRSDPSYRPAPGMSTDDDLEEKIRLLDDIKKARESLRGSLDMLRSGTPGSSSLGENDRERRYSSASGKLLDNPRGRTTSVGSMPLSGRSTPLEPVMTRPLNDVVRPAKEAPKSEWDAYLASRQIVTPTPTSPHSSSHSPYPAQPTSATSSYFPSRERPRESEYIDMPVSVARGIEERRKKTKSMLDQRVSDFGPREGGAGGATYPQEQRHGRSEGHGRESYYGHGQHGSFSSERLLQQRPGSSASYYQPQPSSHPPPPDQGHGPRPERRSRTMSYDQLASRHRNRLSQLQMPVTHKLREGDEHEEKKRIEEEKKKWEIRQKEERVRAERAGRAREEGRESRAGRGEGRRKEEMEDWRRSVVLDAAAPALGPGPGGKKVEKRQSRIVN